MLSQITPVTPAPPETLPSGVTMKEAPAANVIEQVTGSSLPPVALPDPTNTEPANVAPDFRTAAEALRKDALALLEKGDFAAALALYDQALAHAKDTGDGAFVDWIFACRAAASSRLGPANDDLLELKRILLRAGDPQTSFRAAYTSASIYELRRDYKKALFYNRIACEKAAQTGDVFLLTTSTNQLGNIQVADSRFEEAARAYRRSLELAESAGISAVFPAIAKDNLGYCLLALDQSAEGLKLVHEALDYFEREAETGLTVLPLMDLCFGYLKADRFEESRYFGESGLARIDSECDPTVEKNLLYLLGEACHLSGDAEGAQGYFDRLAALYPEFRNLRAYLEVFDFRNVINLRS